MSENRNVCHAKADDKFKKDMTRLKCFTWIGAIIALSSWADLGSETSVRVAFFGAGVTFAAICLVFLRTVDQYRGVNNNRHGEQND